MKGAGLGGKATQVGSRLGWTRAGRPRNLSVSHFLSLCISI